MNNKPSSINHLRPPLNKWSLSSRLFHWISVLLLFVTWIMIIAHFNTDEALYMGLHKAFGMSVLFWMLARIVNRLVMPSPPSVPMPTWQTALAHFTHFALYALLIAMPVAGLMMSMYAGRSVDIFGLFEIPVFVSIDRDMARFYNDLHVSIIWPMIVVFTLLHIGAALYHQLVKKDGVLGRML